ncbi:integrase, catalytic region, zinc finger, CCHC-type containing protein [Tanacetum coccineum]
MGKSYSLFIKGKKHGRMMLVSIDNGPLVYPTIEENRQTRPKKYSKLTEAQQLQDDCNVQATNIILHGLPPDVKFVIDVKLAKSLYTTNYDQLYAYLSQHERHANEVRISRERYPDSLAFVANSPTLSNPSQSPQHSGYSMYPPPQQFTPVYAAPIHHQHHHTPVNPQQHLISPPPFISPSMAQQSQAEFPQLDSASRFPPSNNQLRTSSNPRNQATIQDVGPSRVVKCYNCQGEGHMARQCTQPKRPRNAAWFKEKLMLAEAQEAGQILDEEQLAFLADPDCDDLSLAKAVLMANLSSCDPEVVSKVPYSDSYPNDMINQDVQEMQYSEQTHVDNFKDNEIHSGSNIIPYSQYLQETQDAVIQDTNPFAPNDLLVLSLVE